MDNLIEALWAACTWHAVLANMIGVSLGIVFGALPGLTATMGVALLIPLTFSLPTVTGFSALLGMYVGGVYAGSLTAILVGTPGTGSAAATMLEGPLLTAKGESLRALDMTTMASFVGGMFSLCVLFTVAPQLARAALTFSAPEYFSLGFFGLTVVATLSEGSLLKGAIACCLGMLFAMIGCDPLSGDMRMLFGRHELLNGVAIIPALVGLYALSQVFVSMENIFRGHKLVSENTSTQGLKLREFWCYRKALAIGSCIGTFIGIVPAIGPGAAGFAAYSEVKRHSEHPESFGKGTIEALAGTESSNNAVTGGALIPLLTLGIPGDIVGALLLGALMIQGMNPGPLLFKEQGTLVYGIFIALLLSNIFMLVIGLGAVRVLSKLLLIPGGILYTIVVTLCVVGAYSLNNSYFDLYAMLFFGVLGYAMVKIRAPLAPMLLALILCPVIEINFRQSLEIFSNDYTIFFKRPVCCGFVLISLFLLGKTLFKEFKTWRSGSASQSISA